jgi:hypothetical protein
VDHAADRLRMPLNNYLRVAAHPTARTFSNISRSSKHDQEFQAAEASNDNPVATENILKTLSKIDHARISLTCA